MGFERLRKKKIVHGRILFSLLFLSDSLLTARGVLSDSGGSCWGRRIELHVCAALFYEDFLNTKCHHFAGELLEEYMQKILGQSFAF